MSERKTSAVETGEVKNTKRAKSEERVNKTVRYFGQDVTAESDTKKTQLNNNDLIIGVSGGGKTGSYVVPYILNSDESFIVADTKCNLYHRYKNDLRRRGYKVYNIDLIDPSRGEGYDPLHYIGKHMKNGVEVYNEKDIISIATTLIPVLSQEDPFWEMQARQFLSCLIGYVLEEFSEKDQNLSSVVDAYNMASIGIAKKKQIPFLDKLCEEKPQSFAARRYAMVRSLFSADKTWACTNMFIEAAISVFEFDAVREMVTKPSKFRFENMGFEKTALFLNVSDSDRSLDALVSVFYAQAFQTLMKTADSQPDNKLPVPVRIVLDDFATNCKIEDFDNLISVIRSREISTSIILQSLSQLESIYGVPGKLTILNNCDNILYLGGTDSGTVQFVAERANISPIEVMGLEVDKAYFLQRGQRYARKVTKIPPYSERLNGSSRKRPQKPKDVELY